jgi:hypothetical protein
MLRAYSAALLAIAAIGLGACGSEEEEDVEPPNETAQAVPDLPGGWKVERNDAGGFALGVPPGWKARADGPQTELHTPDELVFVTVTPDRTNEVLGTDLEELADSSGVRYGEQFQGFKLGRTARYRHAYDAYSVEATGKRDGVAQDLEVIVLRRGDLVTFTVFVQRNPDFGSGAYVPTIDRVVRSIRSRPVG